MLSDFGKLGVFILDLGGGSIGLFLTILYLSHSLSKHKLNTVNLVYFRSARVIVNSNDIRIRVAASELTYNTLTGYMVGKTCKGLHTDKPWRSIKNWFWKKIRILITGRILCGDMQTIP